MKTSAGVLMYRKNPPAGGSKTEVLLVHPGGPFWRNKDLGAWSIPKGQYDESEEPLDAAKREFEEETGHRPPRSDRGYQPLGEVKLKSGKIISAWAVRGDIDAENIKSITFEVEWPPRSGKIQKYPEADRAGWFSLAEARKKIHPGQMPFLDVLEKRL